MPLRGILGGAMVGVGEGMTENARELRERALADLRWQREQQMAGEDRAFRSGEARLSREHTSAENLLSREARTEDMERQRQFQAEQGQLERDARRGDRQMQIDARRSEIEQERRWALEDAEQTARAQGYSMSAEEKRALDVAIARHTSEQQVPGTLETEAVTDWAAVETELSRTASGQMLSRRLFGEPDERDDTVDPSDPLGLRGTMQEGGDREARAPRPLVEGNIDLSSRPVVRNDDGSISTVRSISINVDGREVLIPTMDDEGRMLSEDEAVEQYRNTGRHLGVFASPDDASAYARSLSSRQGGARSRDTADGLGLLGRAASAADEARERIARGSDFERPDIGPPTEDDFRASEEADAARAARRAEERSQERAEDIARAVEQVNEIRRRNPGISIDDAIGRALAQMRARPPRGRMRAVELDHDEVRDALRGQAN